MPIDDLIAKYMSPGITVYREDTEALPMIDGKSYLAEIHAAISATGNGDSVYILGLLLEETVDLLGRQPGAPGFQEIGDLLAERAFDGADIRIIISGNPALSAIQPKFGPFRDNVFTVRALRDWIPKNRQTNIPPLSDRVILDWSGSLVGAHHQKVFIIKKANECIAYVGGIDFYRDRIDQSPHTTLSIGNARWGWHDMGIRIRGRAVEPIYNNFVVRWREAVSLPSRRYWLPPLYFGKFNPGPLAADPPALAAPAAVNTPNTAVQILRSFGEWKIDSVIYSQRVPWTHLPPQGVQEVFEAYQTALTAAEQYIYMEDQYFQEFPPFFPQFELYPFIRQAAERGVKVIFVGSGERDPADKGLGPINRTLNLDILLKIVLQLPTNLQKNFVLYRVEHLTVHSKLLLVDDRFLSIGSANFFSRSMTGSDTEMSVASVDNANFIRDFRARLWAEHLRTPVTAALQPHLENISLALGIWRPDWLPLGQPNNTWRSNGQPSGFAPSENVLAVVGP
jgi:phosphatidylserine/phosphatidylglycerophosphate/cardiolipin synthase-like enzyme